MNPESKTAHGGARAGAGRKAIYDKKMLKITVTLPKTHADILRDMGKGNVSLGLRRLLEIYGDAPPKSAPSGISKSR